MDSNGRSPLQIDLTGAVVRPPTLIVGRSFKGSPSLTPTSSPSSRRVSVSPTVRTPPNRVTENGCSTPTKRSSSSSSSSRFPAASIRSFLSSIFSGRRLFPWIVFIALWTLLGLHVQFSWFYMENFTPSNEEITAHIPLERQSIFSSRSSNSVEGHSFVNNAKASWTVEWIWKMLERMKGSTDESEGELDAGAEGHSHSLDKKHGDGNSKELPSKIEEGKSKAILEQALSLPRITTQHKDAEDHMQGLDVLDGLTDFSKSGLDEGIPWSPTPAINYTIGTLVGPFDQLERNVFGPEDDGSIQGSGCRTDSMFAKLVNGKSFVIVLHEISMSGAPLPMLELGTRMRNCGGRVSAVVLNKQGGLFYELVARGIRILQDKAHHSWSAAAKADLVVVGSAAGASWVAQYLKFNPKGGDRLVWWIMENRREYFSRAKFLLGKPKALLFLSDTQANTWREWTANEGLSFPADVGVISLSVNEDLASIAGLANKSDAGVAERRSKLRDEVRGEMGLEANDVLVASLSSINPGKGQLLILQAALMVVDHVENEGLAGLAHVETDSSLEYRSRRTFVTGRQIFSLDGSLNFFNIFQDRGNHPPPSVSGKERDSASSGKERKSKGGDSKSGSRKSRLPLSKGKKSSLKQRGQNLVRKIVFRFRRKVVDSEGQDGKPRLRILIGSVGSKSNKSPYVEKITRLLDRNEHLAKLTLSTPSTTHVAPLYAAADIYVVNAQGMGETFGRLAVEAMAFGLPVLATNAGGSKEIITKNVTGLLHPTGRAGVPVLAQHIRRLLDNKAARERMGLKGREVVDQLYREELMYEKLARKFKQVLDSADSS